MFIPDPDFYPFLIPDLGSRIPDLKTATKERGEKKISCQTLSCSHKFHKIVKIWASFQRIIYFLSKNLSLSSKKYGVGIRDPEKNYSGSRIRVQGQKGTGSRIRIRNTG
jgi:hypothetical protein